MSASGNILLALGGAAVMATGLAGSANAQVVAAGAGACELYAREYAAVHAPQFGLAGWNTAYRYAYNECLAGGPSFVSAAPFRGYGYGYGYGNGPFAALGNALAAPVVAAGNIAGAAVQAGASIAGAALAAPAAIASGAVAALTPDVSVEPVVTPAAAPAPVVSKNYRGTYETVAVVGTPVATASALAVPATMTQGTPEWNAYCAAKYQSFNPDTGMYMAYSGTSRMCN